MPKEIFQALMGQSSRNFSTVKDVDEYVEKQLGHKLKVKPYATTLCSSRGCVHPIHEREVERILEDALKA